MSQTIPTPSLAFSQRARRTVHQPITELMSLGLLARQKGAISLAAGLVDPLTLPADEARSLVEKVLSTPAAARDALQYGSTIGYPPLRKALLAHLARLDGLSPADLHAGPEDILITSGSQQLLFLLTDVLVDPGDIVLTGWPSYFVYTGVLNSAGAEVRGVPLDEGGMVPESLHRALSEIEAAGRLEAVKIVYVQNCHQNPTGLTLADDRKGPILEIVRRFSRHHRILLLEDAAYRELTYDGPAPRSIRRLDETGQYVALLGTFSKPFSPGLRTGYGLLPSDLLSACIQQKGNHDFGSCNFAQHLLAEAMADGTYARHLERLRKAYAAKRDAMGQALERCLGDLGPQGVTWTRPTGGFYYYLTLPERIATGPDSCLLTGALDEGVIYVPGQYCFGADPTQPTPRNTIRLSFAQATLEEIAEGVARLGRAVRKVL